MNKFNINGIEYYFYPSHYIVLEGKTYSFFGLRKSTPLLVFLYKVNNMVNDVLFLDGSGYIHQASEIHAKDITSTGWMIDVTSIVNQGELKLKSDERVWAKKGAVWTPYGENAENGGNGLFTAGFPVIPILIAVVLLGIGATLFVTTKKKGRKKR